MPIDQINNMSLCLVLISTYWNVNQDKKIRLQDILSFNLNLLECK